MNSMYAFKTNHGGYHVIQVIHDLLNEVGSYKYKTELNIYLSTIKNTNSFTLH